MTPLQILDSIRDQVYETSANFWSDAEIYRYMWQAECEIAGLIECNELKNVSVSTVASQQEYTLPAGVLDITRVLYGNKPLKKVSKREKDFYDFNTVTSTDYNGEPDSFYEYGSLIGLYPVPTAIQVITLYYNGQPTEIAAASTTFSIPELFHHYLIDYCLSRMYAKDQDETRAGRHMQLWENNLIKAKNKWQRKKNSGKIFVVKTEDYYPTTELGVI